MKKSLLLLATALGISSAGSDAHAQGWFKATGMLGIPRSGTWSTTAGGVYFNSSGTTTGEIIFPLVLESTASCPSTCNWNAWVYVGVTTQASAQCTLYLVSDSTTLSTPVPAAASPTASSNASYAVLPLSIGYPTLYTAGYVDCYIPPRGWVGNVQWLY